MRERAENRDVCAGHISAGKRPDSVPIAVYACVSGVISTPVGLRGASARVGARAGPRVGARTGARAGARIGESRTVVVAEQAIVDRAVAYGVPGAGVAVPYRIVRRGPRRRRRDSRCRSI